MHPPWSGVFMVFVQAERKKKINNIKIVFFIKMLFIKMKRSLNFHISSP